MFISDRKKRILKAVVEDYIQTAEPVGSKSIAEHCGLDLSPATIRNEMADLESMGFLEQPHKSAGRIPSPLGYRLYVNELMQRHRLSVEETDKINSALHLKMQELDRVLSEAGRILAQLTNYPSYALSSGKARITIRRFDLLLVEQSAFIAVVMTDTNVVKNRLFCLPLNLEEEQLHCLAAILNTHFVNLTAAEISYDTVQTAESAAGPLSGLISLVVSFAIEVMEDLEHYKVYTTGASHLLEHPEYRNIEKAQQLMSFLSDGKELARIPPPDDRSPMKFLIGPENLADALKDTSVVVACYDIGDNMQGLIGVVGPTRMDYARVAARLSYFADGLSRLFGGGELPGQGGTSGSK